MMRTLLASCLMAVVALALPGSSQTASAAEGGKIKIASLMPRGSATEKSFKKLGVKMGEMTGGAWGVKFFPSGVAGDEVDVIRKMNVGQMDASIITTTGLSQIVREVAVLDAPGAVNGYKGLDKVKKELFGEFQKSFESKGMRLLGWGEGGQYRFFSKKPITKVSDLKQMRPWVWPASHVMKEIYGTLGVTGVPLGVPEVYGALQTDMIDSVIATGIAAAGLQWWSKVSNVTANSTGVLLMGFVMTDKRWKQLPPDIQKMIQDEVDNQTADNIAEIRKDDLKTIKKLTTRGLNSVKWDAGAMKEWNDLTAKVRTRMTGRVYPKSMLDKVMALGK